jgi:hypothetical protein
MATVLTASDIAVVQYNSGTTDSFSFVFARDIEAGTVVNFTDNGWLAAGGFRTGEGTVTYTALTAITAGTVVTLTGLNLDDAGDQIIPIRAIRRPRRSCMSSILRTATTPSPAMRPTKTLPPCRPACFTGRLRASTIRHGPSQWWGRSLDNR